MAALLSAITMNNRLVLHREIPDVHCENDGRGADSGLERRVLGIKKRNVSDQCKKNAPFYRH